MSYEVPRTADPFTRLVTIFLAEMNLALDESVPLPRRAAIVVKWSWIIAGVYGGVKPLKTTKLGDEEIREKAFEMLRAVANGLRGIKTGTTL